jgi:segregation and condensation protein A
MGQYHGAAMTYEVRTRVFEGPLDLLLQLITSHQVEITELSLRDLVAEYLAHLEAIRDLDLDLTSEFLLIAATLIQLKARYLLPEDVPVDLDEELALMEERDRLLSRLLACLTFKDVAAVLAHRFEANQRFVPRLAGLDADIVPPPPELKLAISPEQLGVIAERVFMAPMFEPDLDHLELDLPSVDDAITDVRHRLRLELESDFETLVAHCDTEIQVVAYFLAVLELARWGIVSVQQDHRDAPIHLRHHPDASTQGVDIFEQQSEWGT